MSHKLIQADSRGYRYLNTFSGEKSYKLCIALSSGTGVEVSWLYIYPCQNILPEVTRTEWQDLFQNLAISWNLAFGTRFLKDLGKIIERFFSRFSYRDMFQYL